MANSLRGKWNELQELSVQFQGAAPCTGQDYIMVTWIPLSTIS